LKESGVSGLQVSVRAGVAAALAVVAAFLLRLEFPVYALIAAIIVTDLSPLRTRQLGLQRLIGTIIGATLGAAVSTAANHLAHVGPLTIAIGVLGAMLLSHLLGIKEAAKVAGYVCGIVLLDHHDQPWTYALYRFVETVIGIGAAMAVSLIPKLLKADELTTDSGSN
jgi:uncharacterized membrane protein YgaE (UPF0421/DUF939 family)